MKRVQLAADWDEAGWVRGLGVGGQLAWVKLLCYVHRFGRGGRVAKGRVEELAVRWGIEVGDVEGMLRAALEHGVLREDGDFWVLAMVGARGERASGASGLRSGSRLVVPREYAEPIKEAWRRIHLLPDGTDPLTGTDYAILERAIRVIFRQGVLLEEALETIGELGELKRLSAVWAVAKPMAILAHISAHRTGALKRQIEEYRSQSAKRRESLQRVQHEYKPGHDYRRRS